MTKWVDLLALCRVSMDKSPLPVTVTSLHLAFLFGAPPVSKLAESLTSCLRLRRHSPRHRTHRRGWVILVSQRPANLLHGGEHRRAIIVVTRLPSTTSRMMCKSLRCVVCHAKQPPLLTHPQWGLDGSFVLCETRACICIDRAPSCSP